jgi:hypothetical protein
LINPRLTLWRRESFGPWPESDAESFDRASEGGKVAIRLKCAEHPNVEAVESPRGGLAMPNAITTVDDYDKVTQRIAELADCPEGTPQAVELAELVASVMEWDKTHDDATAWKD